MGFKVKMGILSLIFVISLINLGFIGFLVLEGITDTGGVEATNIIVAKGSGGDYTTIQAAINNANNGDTIYIWSGTYYENVVVNKTVTIIGNGTGNTFINGSRTGDTIIVKSDWVNITGLTLTYSGNITWPSDDAGIELNYVNNVHIYDVNCSGNYFGIYLNNSDYNIIEDNILSWNEFIGIFHDRAENNTVENNICNQNLYGIFSFIGGNTNKILDNTCNNNAADGIGIYLSGSHTIVGNTCNYNYGYGLSIGNSNHNLIKNNTCTNNEDGIDLWDSVNTILDNNICDWNSYYGIWVDYCFNTIISNNSCSNNFEDGLEVWGCEDTDFVNNTCNSNNYWGIYMASTDSSNILNNTCNLNSDGGISLEFCSGNTIINNTCSQNSNNGVYFYDSSSNNFMFNNFSNNRYGIDITSDSSHNTFKENKISYNIVEGISIDSGNSYNDFYHNFIISNTQQATDNGNNDWSFNGEGNYWSDYTGLDNGANGRMAGDGIGDTKIPHPDPGMDSYPFIKPYGWLFPGVPVLRDPGDISFDGNYQVSWNQTLRCTGYILEESLTPTFNSPTLIYNGPNNTFNFQNKENNIYYYRAKGYNELDESIWSNIVDIIVDTPPNAPLGLVAKDPTGHEITLSWDQNSDPDLEGYHIFMNNTAAGATGPFHWIHTALKTETQHIVTNLIEETIYYFVLLAFDTHLINSTFSNVVSALTLDVTAPNAPTGVMASVKSNNNIQLTWEANTEQDLIGYIIYMNDTGSDAAGTFHEINTTTGLETRYTVAGRAEQTTYYFKIKAFDEVPNQSPFSNVTYATTLDHTPPSAPTGLQIINHTEDSLTIVWNASPDSDVIGYYIYRGESLSELFAELNSEPTELSQYIDTGLEEATTYYYKVIAIDEVPHESEPSEIVSGRTLYAKHKPEINISMRNFKIPEDSVDMSINLYVWFSDVNNDPLEFRVDGDDYIIVTIHQENGTVILEPEHDWNGKETLTFYAKDDVGEVSDSVIVTITAVNDPPGPAKIISVDDNLVITAGESIDLEAVCDDPDIPYGDKLTYTWSSDLTGLIGKGKVREGVVLSAGHHLITLNVTDTGGASSIATLNITVQKKTTADSDLNYGLIGVLIIIVIIIIILILMLFMRKRKREAEAEVDAQDLSLEGAQAPQPQPTPMQIPPPVPGVQQPTAPMMPYLYPPYGIQPQMQYPPPQPMVAPPEQPEQSAPVPETIQEEPRTTEQESLDQEVAESVEE